MQYTKQISGKKAKLKVYFDHFNERIRVDEYSGNQDEVIRLVQQSADEHSAQKVIIKARSEQLLYFLEKGFELEAVIKGLFRGREQKKSSLMFNSFRKSREIPFINSRFKRQDQPMLKGLQLFMEKYFLSIQYHCNNRNTSGNQWRMEQFSFSLRRRRKS
jgi:hypothetical protein